VGDREKKEDVSSSFVRERITGGGGGSNSISHLKKCRKLCFNLDVKENFRFMNVSFLGTAKPETFLAEYRNSLSFLRRG
jgi:hypothetical protein